MLSLTGCGRITEEALLNERGCLGCHTQCDTRQTTRSMMMLMMLMRSAKRRGSKRPHAGWAGRRNKGLLGLKGCKGSVGCGNIVTRPQTGIRTEDTRISNQEEPACSARNSGSILRPHLSYGRIVVPPCHHYSSHLLTTFCCFSLFSFLP